MDSLIIELNQTHTKEKKIKILNALTEEAEKSDIRSAQIFAKQSLEIALETNNPKQIAENRTKVARYEYLLGNYNEALQLYLLALESYENTKDSRGLIGVYVNIGAIYDRLSDDDRALEIYQKALAELNTNGKEVDDRNPEYKSVLYNNIASTYNKKGDSSRHNQYIQEALKLALQGNDYSTLGVIYNNLGLRSLEQGHVRQARIFLQKSIECRERTNNLDGLAKSYNFLSTYYLNNQMLDSAKWACDQSYKMAQKIGSLESQMNAAMLLGEIFERQNNPAEALKQHKIYATLNDSIKNEKLIRQTTQIQANYDFAKLEKKLQLERQRMNFFYIITILSLLFLVIIAILLNILRHSKTKRTLLENKQLENEIHLKNKEFTTNVMYLARKNELLNEVANKLLDLKDHVKQELKSSLQSIILDLQSEVDHEIWQEFEMRFQQVHNHFYDNLRKNHPNLSPSELRLCAFLRLNMSSKEIAAITHQNVKSIEVSRARIRKKFNLTNTDANLIQYLAEY